MYCIRPVGKVEIEENSCRIVIYEKYRKGLTKLELFSHIQVFWWFHQNDSEMARNRLLVNPPHKNAPENMGVFATHSPFRPNPIALTIAEMKSIDIKNGVIELISIDAFDGSPVIDIKSYTFPKVNHQDVKHPQW